MSISSAVPDNFIRTITDVFGQAGGEWLERLPILLGDCAARWELTVGPPVVPLSYNYVAPAVRVDGTEVMLKAGVPSCELRTEIAALQHFDGRGAVRLLDANEGWGVLLLERLRPGTSLVGFGPEQDVEATSLAAGVMRGLWQPPPPEHEFPTVTDWGQGFQRLRAEFAGGTGPFPVVLVEEAEALFSELAASSTTPVLLHGDLHHDNILAAGQDVWLTIDPKGVVGEPAYEVGALLRNPPNLDSWPDLNRVLARRVRQLADELDLDVARVRGWGVAQLVLSAWWTYEDHGQGWEPTIALAEVMAGVAV